MSATFVKNMARDYPEHAARSGPHYRPALGALEGVMRLASGAWLWVLALLTFQMLSDLPQLILFQMDRPARPSWGLKRRAGQSFYRRARGDR